MTKALDAETETKAEAAWFQTEAKTKAAASETEAKTEAVYLKTEAEAQGSWPILLTMLSSIQLRKIKLNHRHMMFTCNAAAARSLQASSWRYFSPILFIFTCYFNKCNKLQK